MKHSLSRIIPVLVVLLLAGAYLVAANSRGLWPYPQVSGTPSPSAVQYRSTTFGFSIALPESWRGFTVNQIKEDIRDVSGTSANNGVVGSFQLIELHHPLSTAQNPREIMPIMVFTRAQWGHILNEEWSVGAAPIPPSKLGENSKYILALPARYNYDYKTGWEEVDRLVHTLKAFEPGATTSCIPRPACLDATPRCLPPEPAAGWCPKSY